MWYGFKVNGKILAVLWGSERPTRFDFGRPFWSWDDFEIVEVEVREVR
jgi:hypothetical protein